MYDNKGCDLLDYDESDFNTVMASDISFSGRIRFTKPFMIKGNVSGQIIADSDLVIATDAVVNADISADRILVRGKVEGNVVGKKLDFLIQEMNRETNTIGSKSSSIEITNLVIEMKTQIEDIREQVQNIE